MPNFNDLKELGAKKILRLGTKQALSKLTQKISYYLQVWARIRLS